MSWKLKAHKKTTSYTSLKQKWPVFSKPLTVFTFIAGENFNMLQSITSFHFVIHFGRSLKFFFNSHAPYTLRFYFLAFFQFMLTTFPKETGDHDPFSHWHQTNRAPQVLKLISNEPCVPAWTFHKQCSQWVKPNDCQIVFDDLLELRHNKPSNNSLVQRAHSHFLVVFRLKSR